ncbi:MAG TPA: hypothetical protein ENK57_22455 [Polyangiaceae bacterium]|nr:hypothetical protein [Polyangiaceae bacterium]
MSPHDRVRPTRRAERWLLGAILLSAITLGAPEASACHNGVERAVPITRLVSRAADALSRHRPARAARLASRAIRRLRSGRRGARRRLLLGRSKQVLALATLRLDGAVNYERGVVVPSMNATARRRALRWALGILEYGYSSDQGPISTARYAEGLAHFPSQRARARTLLSRLHRADVMPDAYAYRALAAVSDDPAERAEALRACRRRAGARAGSVCTVTEPGDG